MALVCLCHGVSDRKVVRAIDRGALTVDDVGEACGAGTCCHGCHPTIEQMLREHAASRAPRPGHIRSALA